MLRSWGSGLFGGGGLVTKLCLTLRDPIDCGPPDSPAKNTGVGRPFLLQDVADPGIKPRSPALHTDSLPSELRGKPIVFWEHYKCIGFPSGSVVKNPPVNTGAAGDVSSIPGSGRSPGGGNGNPLQHSCLENSMDGEPGRL